MIYLIFLVHSGEPVILVNSELISIHINGSFEISEVTKEHEGIYQCIVSNGVGSALKRDINIKVIGEFNKYVKDKLLMFSLNALYLTSLAYFFNFLTTRKQSRHPISFI